MWCYCNCLFTILPKTILSTCGTQSLPTMYYIHEQSLECTQKLNLADTEVGRKVTHDECPHRDFSECATQTADRLRRAFEGSWKRPLMGVSGAAAAWPGLSNYSSGLRVRNSSGGGGGGGERDKWEVKREGGRRDSVNYNSGRSSFWGATLKRWLVNWHLLGACKWKRSSESDSCVKAAHPPCLVGSTSDVSFELVKRHIRSSKLNVKLSIHLFRSITITDSQSEYKYKFNDKARPA